MGPTGAGKTDIAIELTKYFPCDIISVDSAMIYRGMDIGTAKPSKKILAITPHQLIDICEPNETYSAAQFCHDAHQSIKNTIQNNRIPLLVGGTMLYFRALQQGLSQLPTADPATREKILNEAQLVGWNVLHDQLKKIDPIAGKRIHPNDPQRLQRALEIYELTGQTPSDLYNKKNHPIFPYPIINTVLAPSNREILRDRIATRFHQMLLQRFIEEASRLYQRGDLNLNMPSIRAVGYRQAWQYLNSELTYNEMVERSIIATRQLAKRQLTWLRTWPNCEWFDSLDEKGIDKIKEYISAKLSYISLLPKGEKVSRSDE
jgi:tRNA dimethylallyltransferase